MRARLAEEVRVRPVFVRSVNLERDTAQPRLDAYVLTARALATLDRVSAAMSIPGRSRAWSITGPYGSGKSYFAAFLDALCGPPDRSRSRAEAMLATADEDLCARFRAGRRSLGAEAGLVRAVVTAQREPVAATLVRALRMGADRRWGRRLPAAVGAALEQAEAGDPSARELTELVAEMAARTPVLLVVDEFGKNLEYLTEDPAGGDLFVLQEIAELAAAATSPVLFLTLQHLAFADYAGAAHLDVARRREWAKVQGRFEDVAFVDTGAQAAGLIAATLDHSGATASFKRRVRAWADEAFSALTETGLAPHPVGNAETLARCYPLHPLATVALPELCARFGQHERTLVSFLASTEPGTVASFLADAELPRQALPEVGLEAVYDYFVGAAATMVASAPDAGRWLEVESRLRDVQGLAALELRLLKAIAVLNLVSAGGPLRASPALLSLALEGSLQPSEALSERLERLERGGLVTFRDFADEYRIWQGSDFDVRGHLDEARARVRERPLAELLRRAAPPDPVVAARHTQRVGMLRYFATAYCDRSGPFDVPAGADGLLAYVFGDPPDPRPPSGGRPVVIASLVPPPAVAAAAVDVVAHLEVIGSADELAEDPVARRELQSRAAHAAEVLRARLAEALAPGRPEVSWRMADGSVLSSEAGVSRLLSDVCDRVYNRSPEIRSEMLGRRELTSQGAKARRQLLVAMVEHGREERLGMAGYGPERAMYEAVLRHPGIHRHIPTTETWAFFPPESGSSLIEVWQAVDGLVMSAIDEALSVRRLYAVLEAPPFGLKEGPIPVLLAAVLLHRHDEVAIYQDGTYQPVLTADLLERLLKAPERFALKTFAVSGARGAVLEAVGQAIGVAALGRRRRNPSVVGVAAPLLGEMRTLPEHALRTSSLSTEALAVRAALLGAREPDELVFVELPTACGVAPLEAGAKVSRVAVDRLVRRLTAVLAELRGAYARVVRDSMTRLAEALSLPVDPVELRADLRARARRLEGQVLDPRLRSFLFAASDSQLDDEQWIEALLFNLAGNPPRSWRDEDVRRFEVGLVALAGLFRRVEALHFETLAREGRGFEARQVTVTAPDGTETSSVFCLGRDLAPQVHALARQAAAQARDLAGGEGLGALVAALAEMAGRGEETDQAPSGGLEEEAHG